MGNDNDKIVEIDDGNKVEVIEVQVNPSWHKPRVNIQVPYASTRPHRNLEEEMDMNGAWYSRRPRCPSWSYYHRLIYIYEVALKLLPNT